MNPNPYARIGPNPLIAMNHSLLQVSPTNSIPVYKLFLLGIETLIFKLRPKVEQLALLNRNKKDWS